MTVSVHRAVACMQFQDCDGCCGSQAQPAWPCAAVACVDGRDKGSKLSRCEWLSRFFADSRKHMLHEPLRLKLQHHSSNNRIACAWVSKCPTARVCGSHAPPARHGRHYRHQNSMAWTLLAVLSVHMFCTMPPDALGAWPPDLCSLTRQPALTTEPVCRPCGRRCSACRPIPSHATTEAAPRARYLPSCGAPWRCSRQRSQKGSSRHTRYRTERARCSTSVRSHSPWSQASCSQASRAFAP